jgi:hypothetical protein
MDTVHDVNPTDATLGDLFEADEAALRTALETLGDDDLLLAVLVINTQPIYPGTDERNTAYRLADIYAHAKTSGGASQIACVLFEHVRPDLVMVGLCEKTGVPASVIAEMKRTVGVDLIKFYADHVAALPFGQTFINAALSAELRRIRYIRHAEPSTALVKGLLNHADDIDIVKEAAWFTRRDITIPAMGRLIELGATEAIDELLQDSGTLSLRLQHHDEASRAIAHASRAVQRNLAKSPNLGFVYRQAAAAHLSDAELLHIAESTAHDNVRNSANRELALRGVISISSRELQRL